MDCFEAIVDKWLSDAWLSTHKSAKARRTQLVGVAHHQGNLNVNEYAKKWVCALFSVSCPFIINQLICFMVFLVLIRYFAFHCRRNTIINQCLRDFTHLPWPIRESTKQ